MSIEAEVPGLADPFRGITTNGTHRTGLFSIRSTGVSTEPVRAAADGIPGRALPRRSGRRRQAGGRPEWRKWMNQSFYIRDGVSFLEMSRGPARRAFA